MDYQLRNCFHQTSLLTSLWGHFLGNDWCGKAQFIVGEGIPGLYKKARWESHGAQVSKQQACSLLSASGSVSSRCFKDFAWLRFMENDSVFMRMHFYKNCPATWEVNRRWVRGYVWLRWIYSIWMGSNNLAKGLQESRNLEDFVGKRVVWVNLIMFFQLCG